jgi:hypothetical protein
VGPRAGLDTEARGKILFTCRRSNPDRPAVQPIVILPELTRLLHFSLLSKLLEFVKSVSFFRTGTTGVGVRSVLQCACLALRGVRRAVGEVGEEPKISS